MVKLFSLLFIVFTSVVRADTTFYDYQHYAASLDGNSKESATTFSPEKTFEGFTTAPPATAYSDETMKSSVNEAVNNSDTGNLVKNNLNKKQKYSIDETSPEIKTAKLIESNSDAITMGVSNPYVDCEKKSANCSMQTHQETCQESAVINDVICHEHLVVHAIAHEPVRQQVIVSAASYARDHTTFTIDLSKGAISIEGAQSSDVQVTGWPVEANCVSTAIAYNNDEHYWNDSKISGEFWTDRVYLSQPPASVSCEHPVITVSYDQGHEHYWRKRGIQLSFTVTYVPRPTFEETWVEDCPAISTLIHDDFCATTESRCTVGESERLVDQFPVTESCWEREKIFSCKGSLLDTCVDIKNKSCTQVGSRCALTIGNVCLGYDQTYACQNEVCLGEGIVCGGDFFCMKGDCSVSSPTQNAELGNSLSKFAAVNAAALDVANQNAKTEQVPIFSGAAMHCSDDAAGFSNCCRDSGWGQDINLAHCTDEEKQLGEARASGRTLSVGGSYCSHKVAGICVSHKRSFCVFDSKLALDVQRDGREKQLRISFGDNEDPNCRGLSPQELQKVDFSTIDFSNVMDDIKQSINIPNRSDVEKKLLATINQKHAGGTP